MLLKKVNDVFERVTGRRIAKVARGQADSLDFFDYLAHARDKATQPGVHEERRLFEEYAANNLLCSKSQLFQDLWVLWELREKRNGFFVEFGAFDGVHLSNSFALENVFDWDGLLAEPNPDLYSKIASVRTAKLDRRCVYSETGQTVQFSITTESEYSTISGYSELDHHKISRADHRVVSVESVSLDDFLDQSAAPDIIDYMSLDTEGSEYDILRAFRWERHIRCITVEHNFTSNQSRIDQLMTRQGYIRRLPRVSKWDAWYVHKDDYQPHV